MEPENCECALQFGIHLEPGPNFSDNVTRSP
jgi:hypothetical protein